MFEYDALDRLVRASYPKEKILAIREAQIGDFLAEQEALSNLPGTPQTGPGKGNGNGVPGGGNPGSGGGNPDKGGGKKDSGSLLPDNLVAVAGVFSDAPLYAAGPSRR